ncbi:MAG: pyrroline-5-carboxylate reductase dimerization domain-containing protein [Bacteroidales bacterium]|nr:pyrroline-5-carboxylate reductase dimerization domain-containing protein [Bacteroidales bacterium]
MRHGFIGYGNVIKAIHAYLQKIGEKEFTYISKTNKEKNLKCSMSVNELVANSDIIWLGVKPQNLDEVLSQLANTNINDKLIISPVAGKKIAYIEHALGHKMPIIRIMPNLAMEYGNSVTAYTTNHAVHKHKNFTKKMLQSSGQLIEIDETHFDLFTAIFGSGPAFLLKLIDVQKEKIRELGLKDNQMNNMLAGLLEGTAAYYRNNCNNFSIDELISNIASKGGTTEAGLNYLNENHIDTHFENVINMAQSRSKEL